MTDRYAALTVVLDRDIREDDAEPLIQAIRTRKRHQNGGTMHYRIDLTTAESAALQKLIGRAAGSLRFLEADADIDPSLQLAELLTALGDDLAHRAQPIFKDFPAQATCKNCSEPYNPDDHSDPTYGGFVGPRYCGYCGAQEARIIAAEVGIT